MINCAQCTFATVAPGPDASRARCARNPPQVALIPAQGIGGPTLQVVTYWPEVMPNDACGEGIARPDGDRVQSGLKLA